MSQRAAGIDIHKRVLMVVAATVLSPSGDREAGAADSDEAKEISAKPKVEYESRRLGASATEREHLAAWLRERGVEEVVMESTAQYWKPVWFDLEPHFRRLHLAQAHSNRAPKGRKNDFGDAKRLTRRLLAGELVLSFVPQAEQRCWRTMTRNKQQVVRARVRLQNQMEALLEETRIKLSSVVSDLLGPAAVQQKRAGRRAERPSRAGASGDSQIGSGPAGDVGPAYRCPRPNGCGGAEETFRCGGSAGRSAWIRRKLGATDHRRSGGGRPGVSLRSPIRFLGRHLPGQRGERGAEPQFAFAERKPVFAADPDPGGAGGDQEKGLPFSERVPEADAETRLQRGSLGDCAQAMPAGLEDSDGIRYVEQGEETNPQAKKRRAQKLTQALRKLGYQVTLAPITPPQAGLNPG